MQTTGLVRTCVKPNIRFTLLNLTLGSPNIKSLDRRLGLVVWRQMEIKFIQSNLNMSRPALDLLLHYAKESKAGILLISEPNYIPGTGNWFGSMSGKAAIYVDPNLASVSCEIAKVGSCFVAIYYGQYLLISIYAPPSMDLGRFNTMLDELSDVILYRVSKVIIGGDFNAKARLWGSNTTHRRGLLLTRWAAERDFRLMNLGDKPTCVRPQGCSIIDLTWSSPDLTRFIREWKVDDVESLSDHPYISFGLFSEELSVKTSRSLQRMWNSKKFDADLFTAGLNWGDMAPWEKFLEMLEI